MCNFIASLLSHIGTLYPLALVSLSSLSPALTTTDPPPVYAHFIQDLSFCDWFLSLSTTSSTFIHVVVYVLSTDHSFYG